MVKYYTRACNFFYGKQAKSQIKKKKALPLCGNNYFAFSHLEIFKRQEKKITSKTKIIAITHLSNLTGAILPIKEITQLAHSKNIPVLVDGCQGAPHLKLDMQDLDCDFYAISGHKMYGPTGILSLIHI